MTIQDGDELNTEIATQIAETPATTPIETPAAVEPPKQTMREQLEASHKKIMDRPRDEVGRFTQKQAEEAAKAAAQVPPNAQAQEQKQVVQPVKAERPADMPKAWGADKTAQWNSLTPEAKAYITDRETQMEGFHAKFGGLKDWHEAAAANNTTLPEVLERVSKVENAMIQDPTQGFIMAGEMVGLDRESTARALVGALQRLGYQIPGVQQTQQAQPQLPTEFRQLAERLNGIEQTFHQQAVSRAQDTVDQFMSDPANEFAKDLQDEIAKELKAMKAIGSPVDLKTAYERALWTRPDMREKLVAKQIASSQAAIAQSKTQELEKARSASRSVAGSPPLADGRASGEKPIALRAQLSQALAARAGRV